MYGGAAVRAPGEVENAWGDWQTQWKLHNLRLVLGLNVRPGQLVTIGTTPIVPRFWVDQIASIAAELGAEPVVIMMPFKKLPNIPPWEDFRGEPGTKLTKNILTIPKHYVGAIANSDLYIAAGGPGIHLRRDPVFDEVKGKIPILGVHTVATPQEALHYYTKEEILDIRDTAIKVCRITEKARNFRLITGDGEELTGKLRQGFAVQVYAYGDIYPYVGALMPTDTGEAMHSVVEEETEGTVVIDGYINYLYPLGPISRPLKLTIKNGRIVKGPEPEDDEMARAMNKLLNTNNDPDNKVLCEVGIGTNRYNNAYPFVPSPYFELGNVVKKGYGRIHIGFGENAGLRGYPETDGKNEASVHFDCTILKPTLYLDDKLIIKDGKPVAF